ncbi:hypothetical protein SERLA73DRAFT_23851, partial [Serpula lacrymans var. lacrymans S7.3]
MVGAFHGHAHNRKCQLDWHPLYIEGTGHSEGEGCEHIFSSFNNLARGTRHASTFHRHQAIEQYFTFWDADKYAALTTFFRNHYHEASKAINTLTAELEIIKVELHLTETDFEWFYAEEQKHLTTLTQYPVKDQLYTRYIETLDELHTRQNEWGNARQMANNALSTSHSGSIQDINNALLQARIRVDNAYARLQNSEKNVSDLEVQLCIKERWAIGSTEYNRYQEAKSISKYQTTVDNLECLTVMRLFELS